MEVIICESLSYIVTGLITWQYANYLFGQRSHSYWIGLSFLVGYLFIWGISFLQIPLILFLGLGTVHFLILSIHYRCSIHTAIFHGTYLLFSILASEMLMTLFLDGSAIQLQYDRNNPAMVFSHLIPGKLLYLCFSMIGAGIFTPQKDDLQEPKNMLIFCSIPLFSIISAGVTILTAMEDSPSLPPSFAVPQFSVSSAKMITVHVLSLLAINLIFMALYNRIQKANADNLELQLSLQKEQTDTAHYEALQEQYDVQRILIHDIKNHLQTIDLLAQSENNQDISSYISKLQTDFIPHSPAKLCCEPILNMILLQFHERCQAQNVKFQWDVRDHHLNLFDTPSITALYTNLLNNALEAATSSEGRFVELGVCLKKNPDYLLVTVVNSCDKAPISDNTGKLFSRKTDKLRHGIGMSSIERIVKRYHGISSYRYDPITHQFHYTIRIPVLQ